MSILQSVLKEVNGYLGAIFSKAEAEKDYVFSSHPPGLSYYQVKKNCWGGGGEGHTVLCMQMTL